MERLELYNQYVQKLLESGQAYYARETSEELDAVREEMNKHKRQFRYREQAYTPEQIETYKAE